MEVKEIISYYFYESTKRLDVSFRLTTDSEDEFRTDVIKLDEAKDFGYDIINEDFDIYNLSDEDDDEEFEDFITIDEDLLLNYLNEFYIVNPDKLPKPDFF